MIASLSTDFLSVVHCFYVFDDVDFVWFLLNDHLNVSDDLIWFNDILNKSFEFFLKLYFSLFIKLNLKNFEILIFVVFSLFVEFFGTEPTSHPLEIGLKTTFSSLVLLLSWKWTNSIRNHDNHWQLMKHVGINFFLLTKSSNDHNHFHIWTYFLSFFSLFVKILNWFSPKLNKW